MKTLCFLLLAAAAFSTGAQIRHGTVGVAYFTKDKDKIILAADSRSLRENEPNALPNDSVCKIAAPSGKLVFVSSGISSYDNGGMGDPVQSWSNVDLIHRAYSIASTKPIPTYGHIIETAHKWTNLVSVHLESLRSSHPNDFMDAVKNGHGLLTRAILGGLNDNGILLLSVANVRFQDGAVVSTSEAIECPGGFCAIGASDIEQEFVNRTSARAKKEAQQWKPPVKSKVADYDILKTMRLVELTIKYQRGKDVGGPIDAVEMDRFGRVRWFAVKKNCAIN
jgi:hypothetical protein